MFEYNRIRYKKNNGILLKCIFLILSKYCEIMHTISQCTTHVVPAYSICEVFFYFNDSQCPYFHHMLENQQQN